MSRAASIDIDVNVHLNVSYETAETCVKIVNQFLQNNPGSKLDETKDETQHPDPVYSYDLLIGF